MPAAPPKSKLHDKAIFELYTYRDRERAIKTLMDKHDATRVRAETAVDGAMDENRRANRGVGIKALIVSAIVLGICFAALVSVHRNYFIMWGLGVIGFLGGAVNLFLASPYRNSSWDQEEA